MYAVTYHGGIFKLKYVKAKNSLLRGRRLYITLFITGGTGKEGEGPWALTGVLRIVKPGKYITTLCISHKESLKNGNCGGKHCCLEFRARFLTFARSKLRLCSANHRTGYFSHLARDWLSIVWVYSEQETENGPRWTALYCDKKSQTQTTCVYLTLRMVIASRFATRGGFHPCEYANKAVVPTTVIANYAYMDGTMALSIFRIVRRL